jgi:hypothetical protein
MGLARKAWRVLLALTLGLFAAAVPSRYDELVALCRDARAHGVFPGAGDGLGSIVLSPDVYPFIVLTVEIVFVAAFAITSWGIAWGKTQDWRALFFSAVFIGYPVWVTPTLDSLSLPGGAELVVSLVQAAGLLLAIFFFLLFPDGRFVPRWTRWSGLAWIIYTLSWGFYPNAWFSLIDPFHVPVAVFIALMIGWTTGLAAQAVRYRRYSSPQQRAQTKLVLLAIAGAVAGYAAVYITGALIPGSPLVYDLFVLPTFWFLAIPIAIALGVAMLRYSLFDFSAAIKRTLVYGVVTGVLALAYFSLVLLIQATLPVRDDSPVVVTASTLAVVSLFRPLRTRVQGFVDRRFYRRKYNAIRTIDSFSSRCRAETDLDSLRRELLTVIADTMQPAHASLWLRQHGDSRGELSRPPRSRNDFRTMDL